MRVDRELLKEIEKAQGDGTRESRLRLFGQLRACKAELENRIAFNYFRAENFNQIFRLYSRATVAMILAATIISREERLNRSTVLWAMDILTKWTVRPVLERYALDDGLHPSKIEIYAGSFIRLTTEE